MTSSWYKESQRNPFSSDEKDLKRDWEAKDKNPDLYQQMMDYFNHYGIWPSDGSQILNEDDEGYENFLKQKKNYIENSTNEWERRRSFVTEYGWAIPNKKALEAICDFVGGDSVLEVGAGRGVWAKVLQDMGVNVVATDAFTGYGYSPDVKTHYTPIEDMDHNKALNIYADRNVLFLCWPPYDNPMAYEALDAFQGNKLIYVGEGVGGCTGCDDFHNLLMDEWEEVNWIEIPQWTGMHDVVYLYVRK